MSKLLCVVLGGAIAAASAVWWNSEVAGRVGSAAFGDTFDCLWRIGSGDCGKLWFVGLHQENQIAGLVFWLGIVLAVIGFWPKAPGNSPTKK